jgi:nucleoside-diphosphate-sugar epimerase
VVAITGAASGVGQSLALRLVASDQVRKVLAIDERRGEVPGATWRVLDVRDPAIAEKLRGADVVVHLGLDLDLESDPKARSAFNVRGTQTVLTASAAAGVHRVVLCTSAMVYGAQADNDVPLAEDAPLRATSEASFVDDLLEIERLGRRAPRAHPGLNVTVLRPAVLVGGTDSALTRYFESPRLLVVAGSRLHEAGWRPQWTNEEVLAELLEEVAGRSSVAGRRLGRKDATALGAAGATVALVGAAAAVRRARRRRGL